jgi:hypothetical protein
MTLRIDDVRDVEFHRQHAQRRESLRQVETPSAFRDAVGGKF